LPPEIGQLTALTKFYLGSNQLTALPSEIGQLTALARLFLHSILSVRHCDTNWP
jgi:Leucine-rich repeat (LRR) protein